MTRPTPAHPASGTLTSTTQTPAHQPAALPEQPAGHAAIAKTAHGGHRTEYQTET